MIEEKEILELFELWNNAIQSNEPRNVVTLYDESAILLPTISNKVRHNHYEIMDYFVNFLAKNPVGKINKSNVRIFDDIAINSGIYTFNFKDGTSAQARFTFVYRIINKQWKIIEHHSSLLPE